MASVKIGDSVDQSASLWRYMSLDKLINLLETDSFYFTALETYNKTDPFEGYISKKAFELYGKIFAPEVQALKDEYKKFEEQCQREGTNPSQLTAMREGIEGLGAKTKETYKKLNKSIAVNCWHANPVESEAMWKLYSDNKKGVAIKTSIPSLQRALTHFVQDITVQVGAVKYMDFSDPNIDGRECVTDGHLSPLLKRSSFQHENEVRLFTVPTVSVESGAEIKPESHFVKALASEVIEAVYISPFAGEPYTSSVKAICSKYGIPDEKVIESNLLKGHEALLDSIVAW
ncbi:DUF2971 domain-containing protein [Vibrio gallaecicus]|uniref:DUF2971 domain-containing protein n=1 Tax=Vibrio gallaecicus TaxID=552386 RepID=UPI0010C9C990|nr:DUF2971 domain-containing protein [Vibrio gallaecicus]MDN3617291.1 DUF2971 domain-containing protein [Vibrio gallaecicus]